MSEAGEKLLGAAKEMLAIVQLDDEALTGTRWHDRHGVVRIMGVVEGWVVARRPKCAPFLIHKNEWLARFPQRGTK